MKKIFTFVTILVFGFVLAACGAEYTNDESSEFEGTLMSLEINPSVEFIVDEDGLIESVIATNEDGEVVLIDLDLIGMTYEEALETYINEAMELGFLDVEADNAIIISTDEDVDVPADEAVPTDSDEAIDESEDANDAVETENETIRENAKRTIEESMAKRGLFGVVIEKDLHEEFGAMADEYGIGLGLARIISRALEVNEDLTIEEALEMNRGELMRTLVNSHKETRESFTSERAQEAQEMREEMMNQARERVNEHRQNRSDNVDPDVIRENPETDADAIRDEYRESAPEKRESYESRRDEIVNNARDKINQRGNDDTPTDDSTPDHE